MPTFSALVNLLSAQRSIGRERAFSVYLRIGVQKRIILFSSALCYVGAQKDDVEWPGRFYVDNIKPRRPPHLDRRAGIKNVMVRTTVDPIFQYPFLEGSARLLSQVASEVV